MYEDWGKDIFLDWKWAPKGQEREAGGPAYQGQDSRSISAERSFYGLRQNLSAQSC